MAKQNVTFIERHVEKIVVGVTGAVLLATIVLFGVSSPNKIEVGGEELAPKDFYARLGEAANTARTRLRSGTLDPLPPVPRLAISDDKGPFERAGGLVKLEPLPTFLPPGTPIPGAEATGPAGRIELARILPPKSITVREGRSRGKIPPPELIPVGQSAPAVTPLEPPPDDHVWALVVAGIDRKAQKALFEAAGYEKSFAQLIVAAVEVERQTLGSNGQWGAAEIVNPPRIFATKVLIGAETIKPVEQEGQMIFTDPDRKYVSDYRAALYTPEAQNMILRPAIQDALDNPLAWAPPKKLPGFEFQLDRFGVRYPRMVGGKIVSRAGQVGPVGPTARPQPQPQPGANQARLEMEAKKQARELVEQAKTLIKNREFLKAQEKLEEANGYAQMLTERERKDIYDLMQSILKDVEQQKHELDRRAQIEGALSIQQLGEDQEPLWVTDLSVRSGQTYRYRVRVAAFNDYAGMLGHVKNPADAEKVLLKGEWSEWSEPITITPTVQVFFTEAKTGPNGGKIARMQVFQWSRGEWKETTREFEVGQKLAFKAAANMPQVEYDGTVVSVDSGHPYRPRARAALAADVQTDVLTLVNANGEVEERYAAEDKARLNAFRAITKLDAELANAEVDMGSGARPSYQPGGFSPRGPMMGPMGPGRGGLGDPEGGRGIFGGRRNRPRGEED
ncbi:MAG: hypothetical protein HRF43_11455 [Phycisphaerae bacterium]|jgi:hypothetical protein